jgi:hypothetical protein
MLTHRVLYSDNGVLTDRTLEAKSGGFTQTFVASEDYLYIGQMFPFNSFYLDISTGNTNASILSIQYWGGTVWEDAVDVLDSTASSGVTLSNSGIVRFTINRKNSWKNIDDTTEERNIGDLQDIEIYNNYWIRLKLSADSSTTTFNEISYKFTNDDTVQTLDPDINEYLTAWEAGKTNWLEQILLASRHVVIDLKRKGFIRDVSQILLIDREIELLAAYKTLTLIYNGLGGDKFNQKKEDVNRTYLEILSGINVVVDQNNDGLLHKSEVRIFQGKPCR